MSKSSVVAKVVKYTINEICDYDAYVSSFSTEQKLKVLSNTAEIIIDALKTIYELMIVIHSDSRKG